MIVRGGVDISSISLYDSLVSLHIFEYPSKIIIECYENSLEHRYKEEAEPKLVEFMKECLTKCAERLVEMSAMEKKKKKKKSLPYVVSSLCRCALEDNEHYYDM